MEKAFTKIEEKAIVASNSKTEKVLFVIWYGGHGEIVEGSATTQVVTNDTDVTKRRFPLEQKLSEIAFLNNTYILAFLDCCRVQIKNYCLERTILLELLL